MLIILCMLKYLRLIFTAGIRILWDFLFYINRYARHPEKYPLEKRYKKIHELCVYVVDCMRPDFKAKGLEHIRELEKENKVFLAVCNHQSNMDPIVMLYFCEKPISFVAKKETLKFPFVNKVIKALDGLFLDRDDLRQTLKLMIQLSKRFEKGDLSYLIFPEGTRNKQLDEKLLGEYKPGALKAAKKSGVKILPIACWGNFRLLDKKYNKKRTPIEYTFFEPLDDCYVKENDTEKLTEKIYDMTFSEVKEFKEEDAEFFKKGYEKIPLRKGILR